MFRKTISLTLCLSLFILLFSSIVLYTCPDGGIADWSSWTCFSLSKGQWEDIHTTNGFLFLLTTVLHVFINFGSIVSYLKIHTVQKALPFVISLLLCGVVFTGTLCGWHPMSDVLSLNTSLKAMQVKKLGRPPYPHPEMHTLKKFCSFMRLDAEAVVSGLSGRGLKGNINSSTTLEEIARANGMSPSDLYRIIIEDSGSTEEQLLNKMTSQSRRNGEGKGKGRPAE